MGHSLLSKIFRVPPAAAEERDEGRRRQRKSCSSNRRQVPRRRYNGSRSARGITYEDPHFPPFLSFAFLPSSSVERLKIVVRRLPGGPRSPLPVLSPSFHPQTSKSASWRNFRSLNRRQRCRNAWYFNTEEMVAIGIVAVFTVLVLRMAHRMWKETKQEPGTAGPGNMLCCCLIYFHFLWAILSTSTVQIMKSSGSQVPLCSSGKGGLVTIARL